MEAMRVLLVDDDVLLREGIASLLRSRGHTIVGQAGDTSEVLQLVSSTSPDLLLTDIRMPPTHTVEGLEAALAVRAAHPEVAIMVLSAHVEVHHAMNLVGGGERIGYLLKSRVADIDSFLDALDRVASGGSAIDPSLVQELFNLTQRTRVLDALTERESEVLALMAEGLSNAGIAARLWVAEGTVEKHVRNILVKLSISESETDNRRVHAVLTYLQSR